MEYLRLEKMLSRYSFIRFTLGSGLFLILYLFPISGFGQFREVYRGTDPNNDIHGMYFLSPSTGFIACTKFVGFTQDSGHTFIKRTIDLSNTDYNGYSVGLTLGFNPQGVLAFSSDSILVYGNFSFEPSILFSSNQGQSWKLIYHLPFNPNAGTNPGVIDMKMMADGHTGLAVHHEGILRTTDRGQTWSSVINTPGQTLGKASCPTGNTGYVSGGNNIYKSTDGGLNWTALSFHPNGGDENFNNIFFTGLNTGYCSESISSGIYRTTNGGVSWVLMNNGKVNPAGGNDLYFTNDSTGYAATGLYEVTKTTNFGRNWEICKRNTNYQYLYYPLLSLFFLNSQTGWAGGAGEYLMMTTDGAASTWPGAYFQIDTTGINDSGIVHLVNYSKPGYQYTWYKNDTFLGSSYNISYVHDIYKTFDTIELIVRNGQDADTSIQYAYFNPPVIITSFSPTYGTKGSMINIYGINLFNTNFVSFGNVPGTVFSRSTDQIVAIVGDGASGNVVAATGEGIGRLPGFTYVAEPLVDMPFAIPDTLLCKSEKISISIQQTESGVLYELVDSLDQSYGGAPGNGGLLVFSSNPVSASGVYYIRASRHVTITKKFTRPIYLTVEHPSAIAQAGKINIATGETVNFYSYSAEAKNFTWLFNQDASQSTSAIQFPQKISYNSAGQKTYSLVSSTNSGCADTTSGNAVYVYTKPGVDAGCYAETIDDIDTYELSGAFKTMSPGLNGEYMICASGNQPLLKSRYGLSKQLPDYNTAYIGKYTKEGVLQWAGYTNSGTVNASAVDADGNIYITGACTSSSYFHLNTGNSVLFNVTESEKEPVWSKYNGFILKLDSNGKYLWHVVLYDATPIYQGYPVQGGIGTSIRIQGDRIIVMGAFLSNLTYVRNQQQTTLYSLTNNVYANSNPDDFIISVRRDGSLEWSSLVRFGDSDGRYKLANSGFDKNGNLYVGGYYTALMMVRDAMNTELLLRQPYPSDVGSHGFILKYDTQGKLLWNMHTESSSSDARVYDITVDANGNSYVTGGSSLYDTSNYFTFINADGSKINKNFAGYFISKFDPDGIHRWTQGSRYAYYGGGTAVCLQNDEVCIAGNLSNNGVDSSSFAITSSAGGINHFPITSSEVFIARYDTAGVLKQIRNSGKNIGGDISALNLFTNNKNDLMVGGTVDNWNGGNGVKNIFGTIINYPTTTDVFFAKLGTGFCAPVTTPAAEAGSGGKICPGESFKLSGSSSAGTVSWRSRPEGFTSDSLSPTVTPQETTTFYLTAISATGNVASDSVTIEVNEPLADAGEDKTACNGNAVTIGMINTGDVYNWTSSPSGFTSSVSNPVVSPLVNTAYYLEVSNSGNCIARDTVIILTGNIVVQATADTVICAGDSVYLGLSDSGNQYSWSSSPSGFSSSSSNPVDNPVVSTVYYLKATNGAGCIAFDTVAISVKPIPPKPFISSDTSGLLISSASSGNQWYSEPLQIIPGATLQKYKPADEGWFTVQVISNGCVSAFADSFYFREVTVIPPANTDSGQFIRIGPNPVYHSITVTFHLPNTSSVDYSISNMNGQTLHSGNSLASGDVIYLPNLEKGVYLISFVDATNKRIQTIGFIKN